MVPGVLTGVGIETVIISVMRGSAEGEHVPGPLAAWESTGAGGERVVVGECDCRQIDNQISEMSDSLFDQDIHIYHAAVLLS